MSWNMQFNGHDEPPDPARDATLRRLARAFADTLRAAGFDHHASIATPTLQGGTPLELPAGGPLLIVDGTKLHTGTVTAASATPTHGKPK